MTALETILDICRTAAPSYDVQWGYEADAEEFIATRQTTKRTLFVAVGPHSPGERNELHQATYWVETYSVFMRSGAARPNDIALFNEFVAVRDALDGYTLDGRYIEVLAAAPGVARGFNEASLTLQV